jgi:signal transduction histidine kinase
LVDGSTATHLYRIAQEAVSNAVKHGNAGRIDVDLTSSYAWVTLSVSDDGRGIPARCCRRVPGSA